MLNLALKKATENTTYRITFALADDIGLFPYKPSITELSSLNWMSTYLKLLLREMQNGVIFFNVCIETGCIH